MMESILSFGIYSTKKINVNTKVFVKSKDKRHTIIKNCPFKDFSKVHITFLWKKANKKGIDQLNKVQSGDDKFKSLSDVIYIYCPNGYGRTKLTNTVLEKILDTIARTRNFRTIQALCEQSISNS